jgi:hypothetical protein
LMISSSRCTTFVSKAGRQLPANTRPTSYETPFRCIDLRLSDYYTSEEHGSGFISRRAWLEHLREDPGLRIMLSESLRVDYRQSSQTIKIRHNGCHQLVWITCCDLSSGLALEDKESQQVLKSLTVRAGTPKELKWRRFIAQHLIEQLRELRVFATRFY